MMQDPKAAPVSAEQFTDTSSGLPAADSSARTARSTAGALVDELPHSYISQGGN